MDLAVNNLFDDISADQSQVGHVDYRCFYICNDGPTAVYNVKAWIASQYVDGASVELGVNYRDDLQRITVANYNSISGGYLTLSYGGTPFVVDRNEDIAIWAENFEVALNNLSTLSTVTVLGQASGVNAIFDITFTDEDGRRAHPLITLISNHLTPTPEAVTIEPLQAGSPINSVASEIGVETNPPGGVVFFEANATLPISLPRLDPDDICPIWVKRTMEAGGTAVAEDGFTFRFSAESLGTL